MEGDINVEIFFLSHSATEEDTASQALELPTKRNVEDRPIERIW